MFLSYLQYGFLFHTVFLGQVSWTAAQENVQQPLHSPSTTVKRPNVVFILTDDQDLHMDSLEYMPYLQKHLVDKGTFYKKHFCTIAICCPSRVSLWTGKAAHNTNVTDVFPPYGGYPKFISQGFNDAWLPLWLQEAGYKTYYTGKLFNSHTTDNWNDPHPRGFDGSDFLLDPYTYEYLNATFQRNESPPKSYEGQYSTDVIASKAYNFLEEAVASQKPFFLTIAPIACHSNVKVHQVVSNGPDEENVEFTPPIPAKRHENLFHDIKVPRRANFNPETPSSVSWINKLPRQNQSNIDFNDHYYRNRLRALQAVDEIIDGVVKRLEDYGILDNTYIVYSTDNGFHIGQHRLQPGKTCGFEEDLNIPLIIRGPGVPEGGVTDIVTTHTDLAPTFLDLIGEEPRPDFDGLAIPVTKEGLQAASKLRHEHVNVEFWGVGIFEGKYGPAKTLNNTYKSLRLIGDGYNYYYAVWCNNEHEFYDLNTDPYQINNIYPQKDKHSTDSMISVGRSSTLLSRLLSRLDSLLLVLKSCKGPTCIDPWSVLHPAGNVKNLLDALNVKFDGFYLDDQRRVAFTRCEMGYLIDAEGPQTALNFEELGLMVTKGRNKVDWSEFV